MYMERRTGADVQDVEVKQFKSFSRKLISKLIEAIEALKPFSNNNYNQSQASASYTVVCAYLHLGN